MKAGAKKQAATPSVVQMLKVERAIESVTPPLWCPMETTELWDRDGMPNLPKLKQHFLSEGLLHEDDAIRILTKSYQIMRAEPNLLKLKDPLTVCGDIHGQFYDLCKLFDIGGSPADQRYLFLGDYVDRGFFGCEVVFFLMACKIRYPQTFFLLRGNHECAHLTAYFNFKQECVYKYSESLYDKVIECFSALPLAAVLNGRFLCVHGGLSPEIHTLEDIDGINRFRDPPGSGPMCDLLWSDPIEEEEDVAPDVLFLHNDLRGCSYTYSYSAVCKFLVNNNLLSIIRAHEAQDEGYKLYKKSPTGFPSVICIFSAPNYCDTYDNRAAIIRFQNNLMNIRQFNSSPHPYYLPNFMNAFSWSMPFVAEKVTDMLITMWNVVDEEMGVDSEAADKEALITKERGAQLKSKIIAMGRMARMYKSVRESHEQALVLKGLAGSGNQKVPLSADGSLAPVAGFKEARKVDKVNEKRPALRK